MTEQGDFSDSLEELLEFMSRPDVREQRSRLSFYEFIRGISFVTVVHSIEDLAKLSPSEQEARSLNLAFGFLTGEEIGLILDSKSVEEQQPSEFKLETFVARGSKSAVFIRYNRQFSLALGEGDQSARDELQQVVLEAMDTYAQLTTKGKFVPFKSLDPETLRSLYG